MKDSLTIELIVSAEGSTRCVYDDRFDLKPVGRIAIVRASHIEPTPSGGWLADLSPVGGPKLGPFDKRREALAAEVAWLHKHWLAPPLAIKPSSD